MSAGGIIIIIDSVAQSPLLTIDELAYLRTLRDKPSLSWNERRFVKKLVDRILKGA